MSPRHTGSVPGARGADGKETRLLLPKSWRLNRATRRLPDVPWRLSPRDQQGAPARAGTKAEPQSESKAEGKRSAFRGRDVGLGSSPWSAGGRRTKPKCNGQPWSVGSGPRDGRTLGLCRLPVSAGLASLDGGEAVLTEFRSRTGKVPDVCEIFVYLKINA